MFYPPTKSTIEALLDNDQATLTRNANELSKALKIALGDRCPECGSN
jgi:hypothetical protein